MSDLNLAEQVSSGRWNASANKNKKPSYLNTVPYAPMFWVKWRFECLADLSLSIIRVNEKVWGDANLLVGLFRFLIECGVCLVFVSANARSS